MSKPPDLLAVVPFRPVFHNRSKHNRLLERGRLSTPRSVKADQKFETELELLHPPTEGSFQRGSSPILVGNKKAREQTRALLAGGWSAVDWGYSP